MPRTHRLICSALVGLGVSSRMMVMAADEPLVLDRSTTTTADDSETGRRWAVVIGVEDYIDPTIPDLRYCVDDAKLVAERLAERGGYDADHILLVTDDQPRNHLRPFGATLRVQVRNWLLNAAEGDTVLVFFSGHGFLDDRGQGFLAPADCQKANLGLTALRTDELRDMLRQCKATRKVLLLDCCHAGGEKGDVDPGPSSQELGASFAQAEGLVTLASCRRQETSVEWPEKGHGLFTYFLAEGLSGAADADRNGIVDNDELYNYTLDQVRIMGQKELGVVQTPIRLIGEDVIGRFALARVAAAVPPASVAPAMVAPAAIPAPAMVRLAARFTIREGGNDGPPVSGAEVELLHRSADDEPPTSLGRGRSDEAGAVGLNVALTPDQRDAGTFLVRVDHAEKTREWPLPSFPTTTSWSLYVDPAREITNSIGMRLVRIEPGSFTMGSSNADLARVRELVPTIEEEWIADEQPPHPVRITRPFYLGVHEVTQGQYRAVMGENPSQFQGSDDMPVERVSWENAVAFCERLTAKEGGRLRYRLPTEAEWEYACRAGSTTLYSFGEDLSRLDEYAWYAGNTGGVPDGKPQPVGQKLPNGWGLHDMMGNVSEWCADRYDKAYYAKSPQTDPTGPSEASGQVLRGGGWTDTLGFCRPADRNWTSPRMRLSTLGFRVAADVSTKIEARKAEAPGLSRHHRRRT